MNDLIQLLGDCRAILPTLPDQSVQMIVTSPPYWRMRQYTDGNPCEIGQEPTPTAYAEALADVFAACWRVLRDDGTLWLIIGDAYANDRKWGGRTSGKHAAGLHGTTGIGRRRHQTGLPSKSLIGLPWRVAFALQDQGWVLRNEIIWWKPNAFPEGVAAWDRCSRDHEQVFLFSRRGDYYFNAEAIAEVAAASTRRRAHLGKRPLGPQQQRLMELGLHGASDSLRVYDRETRRPRTVWAIPTEQLRDEHYAPMPQALAERCLRAGSRPGDMVLDPFGGSGTVGRVALRLQRRAILIELNPAYLDIQDRRTDGVQIEALL